MDLRAAVRACRSWLLPRRPARPVREAELASRAPGQIRTLAAAELVAELVPAARQGLLQAGVAAAEADRLLEVISARAASGQTGAAWQRATLAAAERRHDREHALTVMFDRYLQCADTGLPVHTWPVASWPG